MLPKINNFINTFKHTFYTSLPKVNQFIKPNITLITSTMSKITELIARKQSKAKTLKKKSIESQFESIMEGVKLEAETTLEDKISHLHNQLNTLRLTAKSSSIELEGLIQEEIDKLLKGFEKTDEVVKLENFYKISKRVERLKINKFNINTFITKFRLYCIAFMTTIPDGSNLEDLTAPKTVELAEIVNDYHWQSDESDHILNFNNSIYDSYFQKKKTKLTSLKEVIKKFKVNTGANAFSLLIHEDYHLK